MSRYKPSVYVFAYAVHLYVYTHIQTHTLILQTFILWLGELGYGLTNSWPLVYVHLLSVTHSKAILSVAGKEFEDVIKVPSRKIIQMHLTFT